MRVTKFTRDALASRRQRRDLIRLGYEEITMAGGIGMLWQLDRGCRIGWKLVDAKLGVNGRSVYVKAQHSLSEHRNIAMPDRPFEKDDSLSGHDLETLRDWLAEHVSAAKPLTAEYSVGDLVADLDNMLGGMWSDGIDAMGEDA